MAETDVRAELQRLQVRDRPLAIGVCSLPACSASPDPPRSPHPLQAAVESLPADQLRATAAQVRTCRPPGA